MKRNTNTLLKSHDDIEIQTSKQQFSEKTTIFIRERKSCDCINSPNPNQVTISNTSIELKLNNTTTCLMPDKKIPSVNGDEQNLKWGKISGYQTPQDVAKMPMCVLKQLSQDKRFAQLKRRSGISEGNSKLITFDKEIKEKAAQRNNLNQSENNLFNAEYNFISKKEQPNNLGRSLIDSIRNTVSQFVKKEDLHSISDNSDWDKYSDKTTIDLDHVPSFPKETKNATIIPIAKLQSKKSTGPCKFCRQHNKKLQENFNLSFGDKDCKNQRNRLEESESKSTICKIQNPCKNVKTRTQIESQESSVTCDEDNQSSIYQEQKGFDSFKNFDLIPCPRNLLCEQGLHSGKCHQDVRRKLSAPICNNESCVCRMGRDSLDDLKTVLGMGQVNFSRSNDSLGTSLTENCSRNNVSECCANRYENNADSEEEIEESQQKQSFLPFQQDSSEDTVEDDTQSTTTPIHCCHYYHHHHHNHSYNTMNGINGHLHHHNHHSNNHHTNGDSMNGSSSICGGDIITQNQQKGCWTIGLINSKFRYLTAETFGFKINANGASLKKKQIWTLEPVNSNSADSLIYLRSHLDKYLAVDSFGNVTCESEEKDPGSKFQISVADDGSGRWALKNVVRGYFLGSSADKLTCTAKVPGDAEFWHVHLAARPQMNLRSVGRKRFAHLSENLDEIHVDANIPWGEDTLFTLEFRLDESGKYAIHTCNNKYLSLGGKLVEQCTKDCLFSAEYHSGQLALRDRAGSYLSPIGSKAVLKTRSNTVTRDELFSLEDSLPQASFVANLNARFVSVKQGVDVTANQDEISDHETFQLEFDWTTKRWYIRTMQDRYWTLETGGGIQASGDKRSSNALFDLAWQLDGSVAFRANNGRYVITKRSGHLYATADTVEDNSKYYFYLINRPILVLKCEQGFVGYKSSASNKLECNKATYECIQVERGEKGVVYFKGQNGKYWHVDSEGVTADSDAQEGFHLELREPTRLCIKSTSGSYLTASKNGLFRLGDSTFESATQWEY